MEGNDRKYIPTFVWVIIALGIVCGILSFVSALETVPLIQYIIDNIPTDTENYQDIVDVLNASEPYFLGIFILFGALFIISAVGTYVGNRFFWIYNVVFWIIAMIGGISSIFGLIVGIIVIYALFRPDVKEYFGA